MLEKEHIAAAKIDEESKGEPAASPNELAASEEHKPLKLHEDDIVVDQVIMKKDARGTSRDSRATNREQWIVRIRMIDDGRRFNVQADQSQFEKLKDGDRVKVRYRAGKYTGTVWGAEIKKHLAKSPVASRFFVKRSAVAAQMAELDSRVSRRSRAAIPLP